LTQINEIVTVDAISSHYPCSFTGNEHSINDKLKQKLSG